MRKAQKFELLAREDKKKVWSTNQAENAMNRRKDLVHNYEELSFKTRGVLQSTGVN